MPVCSTWWSGAWFFDFTSKGVRSLLPVQASRVTSKPSTCSPNPHSYWQLTYAAGARLNVARCPGDDSQLIINCVIIIIIVVVLNSLPGTRNVSVPPSENYCTYHITDSTRTAVRGNSLPGPVHDGKATEAAFGRLVKTFLFSRCYSTPSALGRREGWGSGVHRWWRYTNSHFDIDVAVWAVSERRTNLAAGILLATGVRLLLLNWSFCCFCKGYALEHCGGSWCADFRFVRLGWFIIDVALVIFCCF